MELGDHSVGRVLFSWWSESCIREAGVEPGATPIVCENMLSKPEKDGKSSDVGGSDSESMLGMLMESKSDSKPGYCVASAVASRS